MALGVLGRPIHDVIALVKNLPARRNGRRQNTTLQGVDLTLAVGIAALLRGARSGSTNQDRESKSHNCETVHTHPPQINYVMCKRTRNTRTLWGLLAGTGLRRIGDYRKREGASYRKRGFKMTSTR